MTIDELYEEWQKDCDLNVTDLTEESRRTPKLHNKYFRYYSLYGMRAAKLKAQFKDLTKAKREWYLGNMDESESKARKWNQVRKRVISSEVQIFIDADPDIIELTLQIGLNDAVVKYLESIVRQINNRGFQIRDIIDFEKFKNGIG